MALEAEFEYFSRIPNSSSQNAGRTLNDLYSLFAGNLLPSELVVFLFFVKYSRAYLLRVFRIAYI
jgi:hypothetical protein